MRLSWSAKRASLAPACSPAAGGLCKHMCKHRLCSCAGDKCQLFCALSTALHIGAGFWQVPLPVAHCTLALTNQQHLCLNRHSNSCVTCTAATLVQSHRSTAGRR